MRIKRRVGLPRMDFHLMNRGARRIAIFRDDEDRGLFIDLLGWACRKHGIRVCAWCLMPNHFHLQARADGSSVIRFIHDLTGSYARKFNKRHRGSGVLFQGPFRSTVVLDDAGLAYVNRYIHLNPVDLGVRPEAYRWSSCRAYLGLDPAPLWLDRSPVFGSDDPDVPSDPDDYAAYLDAAPPRRRKRKPESDFEDALLDLIERRCLEWMEQHGDDFPDIRSATLLGFAAQRHAKIPAHAVARYAGAASAGALRTAVTRFQELVEEWPRLQEALRGLRIPAYRCV